MTITTKFGDKGNTQIVCGDVVTKDSDRIKATGDVDALVTMLGIAKTKLPSWEELLKAQIEFVQRALFVVGSEVACDTKNIKRLKKRISKIDTDYLDKI